MEEAGTELLHLRQVLFGGCFEALVALVGGLDVLGALFLYGRCVDEAATLGVDDLVRLLLAKAHCELLALLEGVLVGSYSKSELQRIIRFMKFLRSSCFESSIILTI